MDGEASLNNNKEIKRTTSPKSLDVTSKERAKLWVLKVIKRHGSKGRGRSGSRKVFDRLTGKGEGKAGLERSSTD